MESARRDERCIQCNALLSLHSFETAICPRDVQKQADQLDGLLAVLWDRAKFNECYEVARHARDLAKAATDLATAIDGAK